MTGDTLDPMERPHPTTTANPGQLVRRSARRRERIPTSGGSTLHLLVLASTTEDTTVVDLATRTVMRVRVPWPDDHEPDIKAFDVVEVTLADDPERDMQGVLTIDPGHAGGGKGSVAIPSREPRVTLVAGRKYSGTWHERARMARRPPARLQETRRSGYLTSSPVTVRPISIRWISEVPSKIVKILVRTAVSAGRWRVGWRGVSTDSAPTQNRS